MILTPISVSEVDGALERFAAGLAAAKRRPRLC